MSKLLGARVSKFNYLSLLEKDIVRTRSS